MELRELRDKGWESLTRSGDTLIRLERETTPEGRTRVKTKTSDVFNFVQRQELILEGQQVIRAACNCGSRGI